MPKTKTVYSFHPETREYLGTEVADESPLEPGVWLIPANATETAPPVIPEGHVAMFATDYWVLELRRIPSVAVGRQPCHAREQALQRLAAFMNSVVESCYARERQLADYVARLPDDLAALDEFDPSKLWSR